MMDINVVVTEQDVARLSAAQPAGMVYYDRYSGAITAISFSEIPELSDQFILIEYHQALEMMSANLAEFIIGIVDDEPRVLHKTTQPIVIQKTGDSLEKTADVRYSPVKMVISVPHDDTVGTVALETEYGVSVDFGSEDQLTFVITKKTLPDEILGIFHIDPLELLEKPQPITFKEPVSTEIDIFTYPLSPMQYVVQTKNVKNRPLPFPMGRFSEMTSMMAGEPNEKVPCLMMEYDGSVISVWTKNGGGPYVDRPLASIGIALCKHGDPEAWVWSSRVMLADLEKGMKFDIGVLPENLDGVAQLYFQNMYFVDLRIS